MSAIRRLLPKPARPSVQVTEDLLRQWFELDERRKELERQARQLDSSQDLVGQDIAAALEAAGKAEIARGAFRGYFEQRAGTVKWREEFTRVAGAETAAALQSAVPPTKKLRVMKIGG